MGQPTMVVDLGTSSTAAALVQGERAVLIKEPMTGADVWPSTMSAEAGVLLAGTAADRAKRSAPRQVIESPRRMLDLDAPIVLADRTVSAAAAVAAYLGSLRAEALRLGPDRVDRLTLVVPVSYGVPDRRRDILIEAGETAGFRDVELISDAHAAVLDAGRAVGLPDGALAVVCDLGDSWRTTLLRIDGAEVMHLGHETSTAGRDLDAMLLDDLRTQCRLEPRLGDAARLAAMDFLRRLKHDLAEAGEVHGRLDEATGEYRLDRQWLDRLAEPGLRWLVASCRSLVARAAAGMGSGGGVAPGTTVADVTAVILVGGGARLACAEPVLREGLGRPVLRPLDPEVAIVRGAVNWLANDRRLFADSPKWRVEPLTWEIPGGRARLVRWSVHEGQTYARGAVLAQVRTADERVFELTAPEAGVLLAQRVRVGELVGPTLVVSSKRPSSCLAGDPPAKRHGLIATGEWLLLPDRTLVECGAGAEHVRLWSIPDGVLLGAFEPYLGGAGPHRGRVFVGPGGRLSLVAWDAAGAFSVFDVHSGQRMVTFRDTSGPLKVKVNEGQWRLTVEAEDSGSAGRYRRSVATVWDLTTGERLDRLTDGRQRGLPGYRDRSAVDGFGDDAVSPCGRLHAVAVPTPAGSAALALQVRPTDHEVFRAEHPPSRRVRVAFTPDGQFLLANWEAPQRSEVEIWEL